MLVMVIMLVHVSLESEPVPLGLISMVGTESGVWVGTRARQYRRDSLSTYVLQCSFIAEQRKVL